MFELRGDLMTQFHASILELRKKNNPLAPGNFPVQFINVLFLCFLRNIISNIVWFMMSAQVYTES
jgi:hypothetical protein